MGVPPYLRALPASRRLIWSVVLARLPGCLRGSPAMLSDQLPHAHTSQPHIMESALDPGRSSSQRRARCEPREILPRIHSVWGARGEPPRGWVPHFPPVRRGVVSPGCRRVSAG